MNEREIAKAGIDGADIRRAVYDADVYVRWDRERGRFDMWKGGKILVIAVWIEPADDWEIVPEPPKAQEAIRCRVEPHSGTLRFECPSNQTWWRLSDVAEVEGYRFEGCVYILPDGREVVTGIYPIFWDSKDRSFSYWYYAADGALTVVEPKFVLLRRRCS